MTSVPPRRPSRSPQSWPTWSTRTASASTSRGCSSRASWSCSCRPASRSSKPASRRAKNAMHTMSMNFMIYAIGMIGFFVVGFGIAFGGLGTIGVANLGGLAPLNGMARSPSANTRGTVRHDRLRPEGGLVRRRRLAFFLFQMVFMDTAATIPTGSMAERWRWKSFVVYGLFISAILYPIFATWAWGGGWLQPARPDRPRQRLRRLRRIGRRPLGRRLVRPRRRDRPRPAHRQVQQGRLRQRDPGPQPDPGDPRHVHPGLRLVRVQPGQHASVPRATAPPHRHRRGRHHARVGLRRLRRRWSTPGGPRASRTRA